MILRYELKTVFTYVHNTVTRYVCLHPNRDSNRKNNFEKKKKITYTREKSVLNPERAQRK